MAKIKMEQKEDDFFFHVASIFYEPLEDDKSRIFQRNTTILMEQPQAIKLTN